MSKIKGKSKFLTVLALSVVLALIVAGSVVFILYETKLKPADFTFTPPVSGDGTGYYRHCYEELSENEKNVYSVILQSIYNTPERIEIPELSDGNLDNIFTAVSHDNPDLFSLGTSCSVYKEGYKTFFEPEYIMNSEQYSAALTEVENIATAIIAGTDAFTSVYEKELYIHDYIVTHCSYADADRNSNANTVYGCLVEGKASCEGYSRTFQYLMSKISVDNRLVTGESTEDGSNYIRHMWNYVVLESQGYFVDLTWDDPRSEGSVLRHTYFNVTTDDILIEHRNIEQSVPLCTANKYNYFVYENAFFTVGSGEQFDSAVTNAVHTALQREYKCVELRFANAALAEQAKNSLFNAGVVYNAFNDSGILQNKSDSKVYYSTNDKLNIICLFF